MSSLSFSDLNLPAAQVTNLDSLGYREMTPIQAAALPGALAGEDLIAQAKTGSGKTAVFGLAILAKLDLASRTPQAVVLCPTRELCIQVAGEIRRLARHQQNVTITLVYGGQAISLQTRSLKSGSHIVVGTPGRMNDHLRRGTLELKSVTTLVLDEADRMLEMGFIEDLETIIKTTSDQRQTLLFSATYPENIQRLSGRFQQNPQRITVDEQHDAANIQQQFFTCGEEEVFEALRKLLLIYQPTSVVVFCNYKDSTRDVCSYLADEGFYALALNGDLEQREREEILTQVKNQSCTVLVATDVAARGLDIKELPMVINFELPRDLEVYTHRIGRTGRAGSTGQALSLVSERAQARLDEINAYQSSTYDAVAIDSLPIGDGEPPIPPNSTLMISGGRKAKVRPGDVLGTLTSEGGIAGTDVGKIDVQDFVAFVAVKRSSATRAFDKLRESKIKGKSYRVRRI